MKLYKYLTLAFATGTLFLQAQETRTRAVEPFQKIELSGVVKVLYTNSDTLSLSVKAPASEHEKVETHVENNTLYITSKSFFTGPAYVYIKNKQLRQLQVSGAASFRTTNAIKADTLVLNISSSANVHTNVNANRIRSVQSGASILVLSGNAETFIAELSGASTLKAYDLVSKSTNIQATGASSSKIYVTDKLKANASGASSIRIKGSVTDINAEASPASSITKIMDKDKKDGKDSTIYNFKRHQVIIIDRDRDAIVSDTSWEERKHYHYFEKDRFRHWAGFSVGVNGYMSSPGNIGIADKYNYMNLDYGHSFNFQLNIIERQFNLVRNNVKIVTGFGFDFHSYALSNKTTLNPDSSFTAGRIDSTNTYTYKKNRLRNTYLQVPLLLEFNTSNNPEKAFHLAFGVIGEYLVAARTKLILEQDKYEIKRVRKDNYNMSPFAAKAHVNFGYRGWTIFAEYNLTPLFEAGKGPELYPFTLGLRVIPFT